MKNKNITVALIAAGASALVISLVLTSPKTKRKIIKGIVDISDIVLYGYYTLTDLIEKKEIEIESHAIEEKNIAYKTHGKINEEKSIHA